MSRLEAIIAGLVVTAVFMAGAWALALLVAPVALIVQIGKRYETWLETRG